MKIMTILKPVLVIPFVSYLLLMPYAAMWNSHNALGDSALDEWYWIVGIVSIIYIIGAIIKGLKNGTK
tara:strand:+ start:12309 stop:12512 length:204 start_codon:yes stop_codon:yes gene_type:complete